MARKTSVDKTPIEKALDAAVAAPVEEKKAPAKRACRTKTAKTAAAEKDAVKEDKAEEKVAEQAAKKASAKKAPAKKAAAAKKEMKSEITVQFAGKSYSQEDLMKIAKDVWRFDLKQKAADLTSVELYVKPEENMVYYVFNGTECGSFAI